MKVLMGIPPKNSKGGPPTHLPYLVDFLDKNKNINLKTFYFGSKSGGKRESNFIKFKNTLFTLLDFIQLVITFSPDIIQLNSAFDKNSLMRDFVFSIVCKILRKNLFFKIHGSHYDLLMTQDKKLLFLIKLYFVGAQKVGVLSEVEKQEFISQFNNPKKMVVVKNIVLPLNELNSPAFWKKDNSKIYCLFVGRIVEKKGLDDLINALPQILKTIPNFVLVVTGDGTLKSSLQNLAKELKISNSIIWLGYVENKFIVNLFKDSELFIFPTHFPEGMPMVLVEALRSGIPIITTKVRFAESYLKENVNCLFIDKGNHKDISLKVKKILNDSELRKKMKLNNPDFINEFSQDVVGEEFVNIYKEMLN